jgi:hypothetical protein
MKRTAVMTTSHPTYRDIQQREETRYRERYIKILITKITHYKSSGSLGITGF